MNRRRWVRHAPWAAPLAMLVVGAWLHRWTDEDAFINFRIVDQIFAGNGPVFNAGERVEVATSVLWLWMLVGLRGLFSWVVPIEWLALIGNLVLTVGALVGALVTATRLATAGMATGGMATGGDAGPVADDRAGHGWSLPLGALVLAALPPVWDYATCGLETGLTVAWIVGCGWTLTRLAVSGDDDRGWGRWALIGLGPLVRPDVGLMTVVFAVAAWRLEGSGGTPGRRSLSRLRLGRLGAGLAAPVAYQVFRMGYYGSLVPNTALAKDSSVLRPRDGLAYLGDLSAPYLLWLPLLVVAACIVGSLRSSGGRVRIVVVALVAAGLIHAAYVAAIGGDYMHARLLLPGLWACCLPVAAVPVHRWAGSRTEGGGRVLLPRPSGVGTVAMLGVVGVWAVVCAGWWRYDLAPRFRGGVPLPVVTDLRTFSQGIAGGTGPPVVHPVTADDYDRDFGRREGLELARRRRAGERGLLVADASNPAVERVVPLNRGGVLARVRSGDALVAARPYIGVFGYSAGVEVHVVDILGLAEPVAARTSSLDDYPAGHRKSFGMPWILARFAEPGATAPGVDPAEVAAARRALSCGGVPRLVQSVDSPLTAGGFLTNLMSAPANTALRLDRDPVVAERELCGPT